MKKKNIQKSLKPSWDEYFLTLTEAVGTRSSCNRGRTGCIITRDHRILATGYSGAPRGLPHCDDIGHEMHKVTHSDGSETEHCIRTTHAEQNAIAVAARFGISLDGGTLYCHMTPCYTCAKMAINAGIKNIVVLKDYLAGKRSKEIFKMAKIKLIIATKEMERYCEMDQKNK
ncbi:MAG: cytidine/deoxycytidylate deaminase family protein [Candidatus Parcubacteria bacterium]|nr:cytidine/deoxycytidylate deaminase family protein [Candidatus Parcubacteria bacterium]